MSNQPATKRKPPTAKQLREQLEVLRLQRELDAEKRFCTLTESAYYGSPDAWDPRLWNQGSNLAFALASITNPGDRRGGANWPLWRDLQALGRLVQASRVMCATNSHAKGLLKNLTNYLIGDGFKYKAASKHTLPDADPGTPGHQDSQRVQRIVAAVQDVIDDFTGAVDQSGLTPWSRREREAFRRSHRDGEAFLRFWGDPDTGRLSVRFVEPEWCVERPGSTYLDGWTFGIRHRMYDADGHLAEDVETVEAYWFANPLNPGDGEEVAAEDVIHIKLPDEDGNVKRGTPTFVHDTFDALERARKLQRNLSEGAALQAAIAWIEQFETASRSQATEYNDAQSTRTQTNPRTGLEEKIRDYSPGTIPVIGKGKEYLPPPANPNGVAHQAIFQGDLRQAASAVCAPEFLISADASNNNYASVKEAGVPFTKNAEADQNHYRGHYLAAVWKAAKWAAQCGRFGLTVEDLALVTIQVTPPNVLVRDPDKQVDTYVKLIGNQLLDPATAISEMGNDPQLVQAGIAKWKKEMAALQPEATPQPGAPTPGKQATESVREAKDASGHEHAADGKFGSGGSGSKKTTPLHNDPTSESGAKAWAEKVANLYGITPAATPSISGTRDNHAGAVNAAGKINLPKDTLKSIETAAGKDPKKWTADEADAVRSLVHEIGHDLIRKPPGNAPVSPEFKDPATGTMKKYYVSHFLNEGINDLLATDAVKQLGAKKQGASAYQGYVNSLVAVADHAGMTGKKLADELVKQPSTSAQLAFLGKQLGANDNDAEYAGAFFAGQAIAKTRGGANMKTDWKTVIQTSIARNPPTPGVRESKDASGHEHAADGKFGSGGGSSGNSGGGNSESKLAKKIGAGPKKALRALDSEALDWHDMNDADVAAVVGGLAKAPFKRLARDYEAYQERAKEVEKGLKTLQSFDQSNPYFQRETEKAANNLKGMERRIGALEDAILKGHGIEPSADVAGAWHRVKST